MPIFEGWKVWKRNMPTTVYDPRVFGLIFFGYIGVSVALSFARDIYGDMVFD